MNTNIAPSHARAHRLVAAMLFFVALLNVGSLLAGNGPTPPERKVRIVLVGDSTVTDTSGWGLGFKRFVTERAECINTAAGGRSSKSFINEGRWKQALALKADYYLIQFGHNDEPGKGLDRETDAHTTFPEFMARYVDEARAAGTKPILVTSLTRRQFDKSGSGKIISSLTPYVEAVKALAAERKVPLVDLHARSIALCEQWGREKCHEFSPVKGTNEFDNTHLNAKGSVLFARLVVEELLKAVPELKPCFRNEPSAEAGNSRTNVFDVRRFGAQGDGRTLDTAAIQKALDECGRAGGGVVHLGPGVYLSKPVFLQSNTTLELEGGATLQATDEPDDFTNPQKANAVLAFVNANNATNVAITGEGTIDGAGGRWWKPVKEAKRLGQPEPRRRPRMVIFNNCKGVRVAGVTLANSPSFHLVPSECEDVVIEGVTIRAPADSPNTDAIDPSACVRVRIIRCLLDVGDDNVALKSGHAVPGRAVACADITVSDCTFLHGHGMSIGSETLGGVRNLTVQRCTFTGTTSGIRIKSGRGRGGTVEDVSYSDIVMKDVDFPINITCYYPKVPKTDVAQPVGSDTPVYRNVRITNLTATSGRTAGMIVGLPESLISDVVLENVNLSTPTGLLVRNASGINLTAVQVQAKQGQPLITENAQIIGTLASTATP